MKSPAGDPKGKLAGDFLRVWESFHKFNSENVEKLPN